MREKEVNHIEIELNEKEKTVVELSEKLEIYETRLRNL
jgi:hypothetical protein